MRFSPRTFQATILAASTVALTVGAFDNSIPFVSQHRIAQNENSRALTSPTSFLQMSTTEAVEKVTSEPSLPTDIKIPASQIRAAQLTTTDGETITLGDKMGKGTSVQEIQDADIAGPFFVTIGDEEKLEAFLEVNPFIPKDQIFVDGYDFTAYKDAGFGRFDEQDKEIVKQVTLEAPDLGGVGEWWKYFSNVMKISPIPKDMKFGDIPEGVLRLGGTFVVNGNDVVYQWSDRLPGDHPEISTVVGAAKESVNTKKDQFSIDSLFKNVFS